MSIKFMIVSIVTATVLFTGCANKDVSNTQTGANSAANSSANASNGGNGTVGSATSSTLANGTASSASAIDAEQGKLKTVLFDFDKFNIKADMMPVAEENAKIVGDKTVSSAKVKLERNADESGTDEYN